MTEQTKIKRIKHVSELPTWFKLVKYNEAKDLNAIGWYEQLCIRAKCLQYLDSDENDPAKKVTPKENFREALEAIRKNPIYKMHADEKLPEYFHSADFTNKVNSISTHHISSVHSMSLIEFDLIRRQLDPQKLQHVAQLEIPLIYNEAEYYESLRKYESWIKEPIHNSTRQELKGMSFSGIEPVIIDLSFPDKILIDRFKRYISNRRAELKIEHLSKLNRPSNFFEWIRYGALPYLDLKIWEKENKIKIPHRVMADAIYPQGEGGEETVRKTTIPLSTSLILDEQLSQLTAQAIFDLVTNDDNQNFPEETH